MLTKVMHCFHKPCLVAGPLARPDAATQSQVKELHKLAPLHTTVWLSHAAFFAFQVNMNMSTEKMDAKTSSQSEPPSQTSEPQLGRLMTEYTMLKSNPIPYAGKLGGNQGFFLDPSDPDTKSLLERTPDASPFMSLKTLLSLDGFKQYVLWKQALMEGGGTLMLCFLSIIPGTSPSLNIQPLPVPSTNAGVYATASFLGPSIGAITNVIAITLFVYSFNVVTGGHLNPMITIATFLCAMTTLPRLILYVGFQAAGASLAGLLVRASFNSTHWKTGGCFFDPNQVTSGQMFAAEFTTALCVIFLAFGVGLDPRQASTFGPAMAPILVGFAVALSAYATAFTIPGYGGAGLNPGRCLAVWVGSGGSLGVTGPSAEFGYTGSNGDRLWIYWIGPIAASMVHAVFYKLVPPWSCSGLGDLEAKKKVMQPDGSEKSNV